jgi:hypothetical protein
MVEGWRESMDGSPRKLLKKRSRWSSRSAHRAGTISESVTSCLQRWDTPRAAISDLRVQMAGNSSLGVVDTDSGRDRPGRRHLGEPYEIVV